MEDGIGEWVTRMRRGDIRGNFHKVVHLNALGGLREGYVSRSKTGATDPHNCSTQENDKVRWQNGDARGYGFARAYGRRLLPLEVNVIGHVSIYEDRVARLVG